MADLLLEDGATLADLATFVGRAKTLDPGGVIRLQAVGSTLAAWVCVMPGRGLGGEGLVLGMRALALARPAMLDAAVPLAALTDRFARAPGPGPGRPPAADRPALLPVPPTRVDPAWMAVSPPRGGWAASAPVPVRDLRAVAEAGRAEIDAGRSPEAVWGREVVDDAVADPEQPSAPGAAQLTAGMAHAAWALGFMPESAPDAAFYRAGRWRRLSLPAGHVLGRV